MGSGIKFTSDQLKAIEHDKGHLLLLACAGSGKTEVVSQRIARLIEKGSNPKNIVAITFTEKAAEELKSRIRRILDEKCPERADFGEMYIGTIHSFCFFMLQELDPKYKSFDVLDDTRRVAYVSKYQNFSRRLNLWPLRETSSGKKLMYYTTIERFLNSADIVMMENLDPGKLTNRKFRSSYYAYRELLEEEKYFDYSSMIHTLVDTLAKDKAMLRNLQKRVKHLIVDEYQDVDQLQEKLIELISIDADSVCVVGDDDQCIYQWRGSQVRNIIGFERKYKKKYKVSRIPLKTNFRSTNAIIRLATGFIKRNKNRLKNKQMEHNPLLKRSFQKGDIIYKHFPTEVKEFEFIYKKIKELDGTDFLDKRNHPYALSRGDFAVLVRTNDDATRVIDFLSERGVDCIAYSGNSIFEMPEVVLAKDCIAFIFGTSGYNRNIPTIKELVANFKKVFNRKKFPKSDYSSFRKKIRAIRREMKSLANKDPKDYLGELGLQAIYHRILNSFGAGSFEFGESYNYNLAVLSQAISDYESVWIRLRTKEIKDFFHFINSYGESTYVEDRNSDPALINVVKVLTIHKAKGLEFPVVFLPCLVKKRSRSSIISFVDEKLFNVESYIGTVEDDRRVFYTAITRSEKYLFLSGSEERLSIKKKYEPHPFIAELDRKYLSPPLVLKRSRSGHPTRSNKQGIFPTSFSELVAFGRCPHDFKLRHIYSYNAGVPTGFGYGTNIHNILNIIHRDYIENGKTPDPKSIDRLFDQHFKLRYATKTIENNFKKAGKKIVNNYIGLHKDDFKYILETEKKFEFVIDEAIISGQIDLLKKLDDKGKVAGVEIIDFKTEDAKQDEVYSLDHAKQLRFYAIACLKSLGLTPEKACVHHLDGKTNKKDYVDISDVHLANTKDEIRSDVASILSKKFPARPSLACKECDYHHICPHKQ